SVSSSLPDNYYRAKDFSTFFQDDWKATPRLTFNLGVRYDYFGFQTDKYGVAVNFDRRLWTPAPAGGQIPFPAFAMPGNTKYAIPGIKLVSDSLVDENPRTNIGPRIGLAYRPFANRPTVVRVGYGIFFERVSNQLLLQRRSGAHLGDSQG